MEINVRSIDNAEYDGLIVGAARHAFDRLGYAPTHTDIDTVAQEVRVRLITPKDHEEGRRDWTGRYLRRTAWFCLLTYLAEKHERTIETGRFLSLDALALDAEEDREGEANMSLHPLYGGILLGLGGGLDDVLRTAPYEVRFDNDEPEFSMYRRDPYAVPSFHLVDKGAPALRANWRSGQALGIAHDELTYHGKSALDAHKSRYVACLRRALPQYMNWLGIESLKDNDRRVLSLINREHLGDAETRKRLGFAPSTFHDVMGRLTRCGFEDTSNHKGERLMKYNPILDSTQRYTHLRDRSRILSMSVSEVLGESEHLFDRVADSTDLDPEDVLRLANNRRLELMMAKVGLDAIERHDERLRSFIRLSVEEPVLGKNIPLPRIEAILRALPKPSARELVFHSLRYRLPVTEVLSFGQGVRMPARSLRSTGSPRPSPRPLRG